MEQRSKTCRVVVFEIVDVGFMALHRHVCPMTGPRPTRPRQVTRMRWTMCLLDGLGSCSSRDRMAPSQ